MMAQCKQAVNVFMGRTLKSPGAKQEARGYLFVRSLGLVNYMCVYIYIYIIYIHVHVHV